MIESTLVCEIVVSPIQPRRKARTANAADSRTAVTSLSPKRREQNDAKVSQASNKNPTSHTTPSNYCSTSSFKSSNRTIVTFLRGIGTLSPPPPSATSSLNSLLAALALLITFGAAL